MCEKGNERIVPTPDWLWESRNSPEIGICIDSCIATKITEGWEQGLRTLGSCCGHGKKPPSVVLCEGFGEVSVAQRLLPDFRLYQWRLTDVTEEIR